MIKKIARLIVIACVVVACSSSVESGNNGGGNDGFDRAALLTFTADNIIIPAFQDLQSKVDALKTSAETFTTTPNQSNLAAVTNDWLNAYKVWQHVEMFNLGRAETLNAYYFFMNTYPVSVTDINNAATSGEYDLNLSNFHDAQGFPAIDFLIHNENALAFFTTNANAQGYKDYLNVLVNRMKSLTDEVSNDWVNNFRDAFVANTENSVTGSVDKLVNAFVFYYEKGFRANKFGIPVGVFSNEPLPEKVEAFYKRDVSKELALEALSAIRDLFNGKSYNNASSGTSLKTYLQELGRDDIVSTLNTKLDMAQDKVESLDANFYQVIVSNTQAMSETYDAIQSVVPNLKTDMPTALGVSIVFQDSDGD